MPHQPTIVLLGAPGTGAQLLHTALAARFAAAEVRIFHSEGLDDPEVAAAVRHDTTTALLMGLDLPCAAGDRPAQEAADAHLRAALSAAGVGYRVVYGQGDQRTANALNAIKNIAASAYRSSAGGHFDSKNDEQTERSARLRAWNCEKCSDPECEHRLFSALMGRDTGL